MKTKKNENISDEETSQKAAIQTCSYDKVFLTYAANLQESTHAEVRFQ